jgi:uncharacterized protein involved in exopolysaccharide biosynthesis
MQRYLASARRYRWLILAILLVVWGAGLFAAFVEYKTTYESQATVWVLRPSPQLTSFDPQDPGLPIIQTMASQQAELLGQLIKTDSFMHDVVERTSLRSASQAAADQRKYLDTLRKRFNIQTLGTNMLRISYTAADPEIPAQMINAALAVRQQRVIEASAMSAAAVTAVYKKDLDTAQAQKLEAQRALDEFDQNHEGALSDDGRRQRGQLLLALSFAQQRANELQGRADRVAVAASILDMTGFEFQLVDQPLVPTKPSGGERSAAILAVVAIMAGALVAAFLVFVGALLADHVAGPADVGRLAPARLFATIPRVAAPNGKDLDLRRLLAAMAFDDTNDAHDRSAS